METVHIYPLATLRPSLRRRLYEAQQEAARVWTVCRDLHLAARQHHTRWPDRDDLHAGHQRAVCPPQPDRPDGLPPVPGQCGHRPRTAPNQSQDPLPLQGQALLPVVLACAGGECGAGTHRLADGTWTPVPGLSSWSCPSRLAGASSSGRTAMNCTSRCPTAPTAHAPGQVAGHGRSGGDPSGGGDHQHGCGAGGVWAGDPLAQAATPHGPRTPGEEAQALSAGLAAVAQASRARRRKVSARKRRQIRDLRHKGTRKVIAFCQAAGRGKPLHRQPGWGAQAEQRTPSQPAHGRLGVRTRHRLSLVQSSKQPASRASLVLSGEQSASVRYAAGNRKSRGASGAAAIPSVPFKGIGMWSAASTCTRWPLEPRLPSPLTSRINEQAP